MPFQAVLFDCDEDTDKISKTTNKSYLLENYPIFEVKIRDAKDDNGQDNLYLPLPFHVASKLFAEDKINSYKYKVLNGV